MLVWAGASTSSFFQYIVSFILAMAAIVSAVAAALLAAPIADPPQPHLAQAWTARSVGDGLPGKIGMESYISEDCPRGVTSENCMHGHIFNYGADTCIKIEVDGGLHFPSGTYYQKCDAVECCFGGKTGSRPERPDVKKWDIAKPGILTSVKFAGMKNTTELEGKAVNAEAWDQRIMVPLPGHKSFGINYTYFITRNNSDIITHRIDFAVPGTSVKAGSILYGDFKVQKDLDSFRKTFYPPAVCAKARRCSEGQEEEWNKKYFSSSLAGSAEW